MFVELQTSIYVLFADILTSYASEIAWMGVMSPHQMQAELSLVKISRIENSFSVFKILIWIFQVLLPRVVQTGEHAIRNTSLTEVALLIVVNAA